MRLPSPGQKILKVVDKDHQSYNKIIKAIQNIGFQWIGEGNFTTTYGKKNTQYVIKINNRCDPAAYKFYSMLKDIDAPLEYFPKVHKLRNYVDENGEFLFVAIVEKLIPLNDDSWKKTNQNGKGFASWIATHEEAYIDAVDMDFEQVAKIWQSENRNVVKIVKSIFKVTSKYAEPDLHGGNLMLRPSTGDVILNDPLSIIVE